MKPKLPPQEKRVRPPAYCPHIDGNVFEWILKVAESMRKKDEPAPGLTVVERRL